MANENVLADSLAEYLAPKRTDRVLEEARQKWRMQVITDPAIEKKIRAIYVTLVGDKDMSGYSQFLRQLDDLFLQHRDEERSEDNDDKPVDKESEDDADNEEDSSEDSEDDGSEENAAMIPKQSRFISGILRSLAGSQGNKTVQAYLDGDVKRFARNWSELSNRMLMNCQNIHRKSGKDMAHEKKMGRHIVAALTSTDKETN